MAGQEFVGTIVDERYKIVSLIGQGGMGSVYRAHEIGLNRTVALKILHSSLLADPEHLARFEREAKLLSTFRHRNVLAVYRFGRCNQHEPYLAMEYVDGESLRDLLNREGHLSFSRSLAIAIQCCRALQCAHEANVVHRDIKPSNIMLISGDEPDYVKIVDFGLSKLLADAGAAKQKLTSTGSLIGSPQYMSPEQAMGKSADERSDIYALALVIYEAVAGVPPYTADNPIGLLHKHVSEMVPPLDQFIKDKTIPAGFESVLQRALSKDPGARYQTMGEFAECLETVRDGGGILLEAAYPINRRSSQSLKKKRGVLIAGLILSVVVFAFFKTFSFLEERKAIAVKDNLVIGHKSPGSKWEREMARAEALFEQASEMLNKGETRQASEAAGRSINALCVFQRALTDDYRERALALVGKLQSLVVKLPPDSLPRADFHNRLLESLEPLSVQERIPVSTLCLEIYTNVRQWHRVILELHYLEGFYEHEGKLGKARAVLERARAIERKYLLGDPLMNTYIYVDTMRLCLAEKDNLAAAKYAELGERSLEKAKGDNLFERLGVTEALAEFYSRSGNYEKAKKLYEEWSDLQRQHSAKGNYSTERAGLKIAEFYKNYGRLDLATTYLDSADLEHRERESRNDDKFYNCFMQYLHAELLYEDGRYSAASEKLQSALDDLLYLKGRGNAKEMRMKILILLADSCRQMKKYDLAERYYMRCLSTFGDKAILKGSEKQDCLFQLCKTYCEAGELAKAEAMLRRLPVQSLNRLRARADLEMARGNLPAAQEYLYGGLAENRTLFWREDILQHCQMLSDLEMLLTRTKNMAKARECLVEEVSLLKKIQAPESKLLKMKVSQLNNMK